MKNISIFLVTLIISIAILIAATIVGFTIFTSAQNPYNWMIQMWGGHSGSTTGMGGMMGEPTTNIATNSLLTYFGLLYAVLIGVTIISVVGVAYYLIYPQIRVGTIKPPTSTLIYGNGSTAYESVFKTLTLEERKVIDVLSINEGKYLQKYIKNETGLSRLKTHRIIARLAERDIVSLEKAGNTNQVYLANWLKQKV